MKPLTSFIHRDNLALRSQQFLILVLHLALLRWIFYVLNNSGSMEVSKVLYHFTGLSIAGALLIRGCAYWGRRLYLIEQKEQNER